METKLKKGLRIALCILVLLSNFLSFGISSAIAATGTSGTIPSITTNKTTYLIGEDITVNFNNGPGNATDWIGVYNSTDTPGVQSSTIWSYVKGSTGSVTFKGGLSGAGSFKVYFLASDGYTKICNELTITVKNSTTLGPVMTVNGVVPGAVAKGTEITVPSATATDDVDGTVNVVVSLTDPQNKNVTLTNNKFVATTQGTYTVTYTATNSRNNVATQPYTIKVTDPGNKVTFGVISDTHVTPTKALEQKRLAQAFQFFNTNKVDADVVVGDLTDYGSSAEYSTFKAIMDANKGNIKLIASMGNHEYNQAGGFTAITGDVPNANYVINGYHFITLSPGTGTFDPATGKGTTQGGADFTYVANWVKTQLDAAVAEDPNKPIFVFFHEPLQNTYYMSDEYYSTGLSTGKDATFQSVFSQYRQVVAFSGHIHSPNNDPQSIWQDGGFTAVNTVSLSYFWMEPGMVYGPVPPDGWKKGAQGMLIEANGSKVTIKNYDFVSGQYIPQTWTFDVSKPSEFPYTHARDAVAKAPVFPRSAAVRVSNITDNGATVNFDQAVMKPNKIGDIVHSYRYDFVNKTTGKVDSSFKTWSEFYVVPMPATITQAAVGLLPATDYEVKIYATDSYQKTSDSYSSASFKTKSVPLVIPTIPVAPGLGVQEPVKNTFGWVNVPGFANPTDYEYSVDGGLSNALTYSPCTANPIQLPNHFFAKGSINVRVKADNVISRPAGDALSSTVDFTGSSSGPNYTGISINNAKIVTIKFSENLFLSIPFVANVTNLKAAVSIAADGFNYQPLGSNDTVVIKGSTLEITFAKKLEGKANRLKIDANVLKNQNGNVQTKEIMTDTINATHEVNISQDNQDNQAATKSEGEVKTVSDSLVTAGTIAQVQADTIQTAITVARAA